MVCSGRGEQRDEKLRVADFPGSSQINPMHRLNLLLCGALCCLVAGCGPSPEPEFDSAGRAIVEVWAHAGQPEERATLEQLISRYHEQQSEVRIRLTMIPEGDYNAQVQSAAFSGDLPDLLEFDGPFLFSYAWQGHLQPIGDLLPASVTGDLLPSVVEQGTWRNQLYAVGMFDSGLGLYARPSVLAELDIRLPSSPADAWTIAEFNDILSRLSEDNPGQPVLDLKLNYSGEWFTYAFSPLLVSGGADLVSRTGELTATGILDSPAAIAAMQHVQQWFQNGWVHPNFDDTAFIRGEVPFSWSGHWEFPRFNEHLGEDLILLPLPDFGHGSRTGQGSWVWGLTRQARHPESAMDFLTFLLQTDSILAMSAANGAVPARREAIARSPDYAPGGTLHLFVQQLEETAVPRPQTPAYPVITSVFQDFFARLRDNGDVPSLLREAARRIDEDIADNRGYPIRNE